MLPSSRLFIPTLSCRGLIFQLGRSSLSTSAAKCRKNYLNELEDYSGIEMPSKPRLSVLPKVPVLPNGVKYVKMKKSLHLLRGPETVHNALLHEQYGIVALCGGRLKHSHLEMIRITVARNLDQSRMFALWRVNEPWQPVSKRGIGKRHGGGKGAIDHYVSPVKEGRIIIEVGGKCSYEEVKPWLEKIAHVLPFKAMAVDQKTMLATKKLEELKEQRNVNPYTYKYLIMNRMCGSENWVKPIDKIYFGKYV